MFSVLPMLIRVSKNLITLNYARICINLNINFSSDTLEKEMVKMENSFILYVIRHHYLIKITKISNNKNIKGDKERKR